MKIKFDFTQLPYILRRQFLLQILFANFVVAAISIMAQHSFGEHSVVQWRNGNDNNSVSINSNSSIPVSHDLRWRKPNADSVNRNSQYVIPLPESESSILLVQHVESMSRPPVMSFAQTTPTPTLPGEPQPKPADPYEQERFKSNIPTLKPNPLPGATNTPSTQQLSSPNYSSGNKSDDSSSVNQQSKSNNSNSNSDSNSATTKSNTTLSTPTTSDESSRAIRNIPDTSTNPLPVTGDVPLILNGESTLPLESINSSLVIDPNTTTHDCRVIGFKPINEISCDIKPRPGRLPEECPLTSEPYMGRQFSQTCFQWKASAVCTKGAYFENVQLERYGHSVCPTLEPVISGVKFFTTIPILPYKAGLTLPNECVYTLGHYRVGNCAPHQLDPLPISVRAILFEGAAAVGAAALIP
ncbi:MAG: hypothetical protein LBB88_08505 [Planctomycetaceae bacterium]|jgi:hypothetical protein|nr:hypothetical protein [Planctomycetaceae bacterium]